MGAGISASPHIFVFTMTFMFLTDASLSVYTPGSSIYSADTSAALEEILVFNHSNLFVQLLSTLRHQRSLTEHFHVISSHFVLLSATFINDSWLLLKGHVTRSTINFFYMHE